MQNEFPRCPICGSTTSYELSGILSRYARCNVCMSKWRIGIENKRISTLILYELPKNGSGLYKIVSKNAPLFTVLRTPLPIEFWKNLKLDERIDWEFLSKDVSSSVSESVIKEKGEQILHQWNGIRIIPAVKVVSGNSVKTKIEQSGSLLLTTRRLIWLEMRSTGFWKVTTSFHVVYEIPLEHISGISGETGNIDNWGSLTKVSVADTSKESMFALGHAFLELFKPMVENAIEMRRKEIETEKKKERLHVMLDFSFLKAHMEKGGLIMQVLKCPECGATIDFPKSGTQTKCSYCGKTIYAQDIFEKIKNLLE